MHYIMDRLKEPGTMRSLIWVLVGLMGSQASESDVATYAGLATMVLGMVSALMPEKATKAAAVVEQAAATAQVAATTAASAVREIGAVTTQATLLVDSARSLAGANNVVEIRK